MKITAWDRFLLSLAPEWTLRRMQARAAAMALRSYDAASQGRRTKGWKRDRRDANAILAQAAPELRLHARHLVANNGYAKRAQNVIANNVVGYGVSANPAGPTAAKAAEVWNAWAGSTDCDADGQDTFAGLQRQVMLACVQDGEVLVRRRVRRPEDGLVLPLQLQVLEIDRLDSTKSAELQGGGHIEQGIEYDGIGRREAYWLWDRHPGGTRPSGSESRRIPSSEVAHIFLKERVEQRRGVSWLAAAIVDLKDLSDYDDAELVKQKIAACFAAFVIDADGMGRPIGDLGVNVGGSAAAPPQLEGFQPGMIQTLEGGKDVKFATPPPVTTDSFAGRVLRRAAVGLGVTYEDMTGDYSGVNFSSARMGRIAHERNVETWRWMMLVPQLCERVWRWAMDVAVLAKLVPEVAPVTWIAPPLPMLEPDKEGLAAIRRVRGGLATFSEIVREQGHDPEKFFAEYAADKQRLDKLAIKLDSDVSAVSQAGLTQERVGGGGQGKPPADEQPAS